MDSKSFNVEGTSGTKLSAGIGVPTILGNQLLDFLGGNKYMPAVADALEKGIIKAAEWLSGRKGIMISPEVSGNNEPGAESVTITITNSDYSKSKEFTDMLKSNAAKKIWNRILKMVHLLFHSIMMERL